MSAAPAPRVYLDPTCIEMMVRAELADDIAPADVPGFGVLMRAVDVFNAVNEGKVQPCRGVPL